MRVFVTRLCRDRDIKGTDVVDVKVTKVDHPFVQDSTGLEISFKVSDHYFAKSTSTQAAKDALLRALGEELSDS